MQNARDHCGGRQLGHARDIEDGTRGGCAKGLREHWSGLRMDCRLDGIDVLEMRLPADSSQALRHLSASRKLNQFEIDGAEVAIDFPEVGLFALLGGVVGLLSAVEDGGVGVSVGLKHLVVGTGS